MPSKRSNKFLSIILKFLPLAFCMLFFIAFSVLSIVRHLNYQSFGYDLGINDQVVWRYSKFQLPLTTIDPFPDKLKFAEHVELVYALVAPFYWIHNSPVTLILVRNGWFCLSAIAVFLLARKKKLNYFLSLIFIVLYLIFYGAQNALWTDVHSNEFATGFLIWFIYFLESKRKKLSILFFFLAITAKENIGLYTFLIAGIFYLKNKSRLMLFFMAASVLYVAFIFFIFFPEIMHVSYLYANKGGMLSNINLVNFFDTNEKRQVIWYSLLSFGFIPLLAPLYLLPAIGSLGLYFVIANQLPGAQGLFGQYRIVLSTLLSFAGIYAISRFSIFNKWYVGLYLIICALAVQYFLHLPLSYLTKQWFWQEPIAVHNINALIKDYLPVGSSVVSQNNITPHISERDKIYTLYPEKKSFTKNSPCDKNECNWFRWYDNPEFLIVDTSLNWDIRHLLADRRVFLDGLNNMEKSGIIKKYKQIGSATLYKVVKNPGR